LQIDEFEVEELEAKELELELGAEVLEVEDSSCGETIEWSWVKWRVEVVFGVRISLMSRRRVGSRVV
jgi:hypothetical protein